MALNIKSAETDRLVRELATLTGESITEAITKAVGERLDRCRKLSEHQAAERAANLHAILEEAWKLPVKDATTPEDEILGYNEHGTFD